MNTYLIDINDLKETNRAFGGNAGAKVGVIWNNEEWIVKYPKNIKNLSKVILSYSTGPLSEFIGSHIYEILGFDVHKTVLGYDNDKLVVLCKNFNLDGKLIEFKNIANRLRSKEIDYLSYTDGNSTDLNKIIETIKLSQLIKCKEKALNHFWDMFLVDYLINNSDRNNTNRGFIINPLNINEEEKISPIYDCGNCLNNKLSDQEMSNKIKNYDEFFYFAVSSLSSCFELNGHHINFTNAIQNENILNIGLRESIIRNVPIIKNKIDQIKTFIYNIPEEENGIDICSKIKKNFIFSTIEIRLNKVLIPAYNNLSKTTN